MVCVRVQINETTKCSRSQRGTIDMCVVRTTRLQLLTRSPARIDDVQKLIHVPVCAVCGVYKDCRDVNTYRSESTQR